MKEIKDLHCKAFNQCIRLLWSTSDRVQEIQSIQMHVVLYIQYIGIYALVSLQERTDTIEDILGRKELQCTKEATQITHQ